MGKVLTIDPNATDVTLGVYKAKQGQLTVQSMESDEYKRETEARKGRNRAKELAMLTEPERAMVEKANAQGKGVLWNKGNGQSYYFVAQKPDEKQAGKDADKEKKAEAEKEKGGFLDWCGRNWGWLVAGAAAIAAGIIFLTRKNRKKKSSNGSVSTATKGTNSKTSNSTNTNTTENTDSNTVTTQNSSSKPIVTPAVQTPTVSEPSVSTPATELVESPVVPTQSDVSTRLNAASQGRVDDGQIGEAVSVVRNPYSGHGHDVY
ncbi:MAG: hypothetical protein E7014_06340 [Alphaproteobacteria bacterium]|nr:hypothetical protein [Alphaproteobacteria bacterium]